MVLFFAMFLSVQAAPPKDWMDKTTWVFGAILVVVGIWGVCAAVRTLRIIERQTVAIEQQTKLQSAQWVALKNWRAQLLEPYILSIKVDVVNETNFPSPWKELISE